MFREDDDDQRVNNPLPLEAQPVSPTAAQFGAGDIGHGALVAAVTFSVLATIVVVLRWYTRARIVRCIGLDDYVIILSLVRDVYAEIANDFFDALQLLSWAMCIIIGFSVDEGVGMYRGAINTVLIAKLIVANNTAWSILVNITKASILTQYLRIFGGRVTRGLCYFLLFLLLPAVCWGVFGGIFLCNPPNKLWNPHLSGQCMNAQAYWSSVAAVDIFLDFWVLFLPMPSIAGLHLPRKQKIATMLAFLLGFIVCVIGVARLVTVLVTAEKGDYVLSGVWSIIWSAIEGNVSIICASLLSLKSLVTKLFPRLLEEREPPKHAMRLPTITEEEQVWKLGDPDDRTMEDSGCSWASTAKPGEESVAESGGIWRLPPAVPPVSQSGRAGHRATDSRGDVLDFIEMLKDEGRK